MIGKKIAEIRKSQKLSQSALGKLVGTSGDVIGRYERGVITPSIEAVIKIAQELGVSIDYLVGKTSTLLDEKTLERFEKIGSMPSEEKNTILRVVDALIRDYSTRQAYQ